MAWCLGRRDHSLPSQLIRPLLYLTELWWLVWLAGLSLGSDEAFTLSLHGITNNPGCRTSTSSSITNSLAHHLNIGNFTLILGDHSIPIPVSLWQINQDLGSFTHKSNLQVIPLFFIRQDWTRKDFQDSLYYSRKSILHLSYLSHLRNNICLIPFIIFFNNLNVLI